MGTYASRWNRNLEAPLGRHTVSLDISLTIGSTRFFERGGLDERLLDSLGGGGFFMMQDNLGERIRCRGAARLIGRNGIEGTDSLPA